MSSNHYCPGCGKEQTTGSLRYPWHFCEACLQLAETGHGQRLEFTNASLSGGLSYKNVVTNDSKWNCGVVLCLIRGRPALVTEAYFGGVVAQPVNSEHAEMIAGRGSVVDFRISKKDTSTYRG
jgi:hypothetical protein